MRLVSPLLKHVVYPSLARSGYLRRRLGQGPAVVTYHGVFPRGYRSMDPALDGALVSREKLQQQLQLLKNKYHVISPREFLLWCEAKIELPPRSVMLTCDDGLHNTLSDMLPLLQEFNLSCLFFVTGGSLSDAPQMLWYDELYLMLLEAPDGFFLDFPKAGISESVNGREGKRALWWKMVRKLSQHDAGSRRVLLQLVRTSLGISDGWNLRYFDAVNGKRFSLLNLAGVQSLAAAGMCIGAHTQSHPMLSQMPSELVWREISENHRDLEQALGQPVWALAYPFGDAGSVTSRELDLAERAGYACAFLNVGGGFGAAAPRFALPRVHVTATMTLAEFEAHVSGFHRSLRQRLTRHDDATLPAAAARAGA